MIIGFLFSLGLLSLSCWIAFDLIPHQWIPIKQTYDHVLIESCQYFNGSSVLSSCSNGPNYDCWLILSSVKVLNETYHLMIYDRYYYQPTVQSVINQMPFIEDCQVNTCNFEYKGSHPKECPMSQNISLIIPKYENPMLGFYMFLYICGMIPFFIPVVILSLWINDYRSRNDYQFIPNTV